MAVRSLNMSEGMVIAIHAATYLSHFDGKTVSTREICDTYRFSRNHMLKVLHRLAKLDLITASKGRWGGFYLTAKQRESTLMEIFVAIEGKYEFTECLMGRSKCAMPEIKCPSCKLLKEVNKTYHDYLANTKISDLAEPACV